MRRRTWFEVDPEGVHGIRSRHCLCNEPSVTRVWMETRPGHSVFGRACENEACVSALLALLEKHAAGLGSFTWGVGPDAVP